MKVVYRKTEKSRLNSSVPFWNTGTGRWHDVLRSVYSQDAARERLRTVHRSNYRLRRTTNAAPGWTCNICVLWFRRSSVTPTCGSNSYITRMTAFMKSAENIAMSNIAIRNHSASIRLLRWKSTKRWPRSWTRRQTEQQSNNWCKHSSMTR